MGCVSLPDLAEYAEWIALPDPRTERAGDPSRAGTGAISKGSSDAAGSPDILTRHLAFQEHLVGTPLKTGNRATLLQDGAETYRAMAAAIRQARDHVHLETYIFDDDETGHGFAELLIEKRRQGVQVSLLYDGIGSMDTPKQFFQHLEANGIRVLEFNPVSRPWNVNKRDHRKLLIVDGRVAFLGGINISNVYSRGSVSRRVYPTPREKVAQWRDTHVQIEGPAVADFQKLFLDTWTRLAGTQPPGNHFPPPETRGADTVHAVGSGADQPHRMIYLILISAILNAKSHIYITNAYFVPDAQFMRALKTAARRGVDVRLLFPSQTDFWLVFHAGRSHYTELLEAGVRIYERRGAVLHSKTLLIDGVWSCVGTTNLDWRSFLHNNEVDAVIVGEEFGRRMQAMFARDLEQSDRIELKHWRERPFATKFKEQFSWLWEYWL